MSNSLIKELYKVRKKTNPLWGISLKYSVVGGVRSVATHQLAEQDHNKPQPSGDEGEDNVEDHESASVRLGTGHDVSFGRNVSYIPLFYPRTPPGIFSNRKKIKALF